MAQLMLINPRRAKRTHKRKTHARRRRHSARRHTLTMNANPRKRRRKSRLAARVTRAHKATRRFAGRKSRAAFGRGGMKGYMQGTLLPATTGAVGALGLDIIMGYLPLPAMMTTGFVRPIVRLAGAGLLGWAAGAMVNRDVGVKVATGATVVVLYDFLKGLVKTAMPNLPLSEVPGGMYGVPGGMYGYPNLEYINAGYPAGTDQSVTQPMGEYVSMGEYVAY